MLGASASNKATVELSNAVRHQLKTVKEDAEELSRMQKERAKKAVKDAKVTDYDCSKAFCATNCCCVASLSSLGVFCSLWHVEKGHDGRRERVSRGAGGDCRVGVQTHRRVREAGEESEFWRESHRRLVRSVRVLLLFPLLDTRLFEILLFVENFDVFFHGQ